MPRRLLTNALALGVLGAALAVIAGCGDVAATSSGSSSTNAAPPGTGRLSGIVVQPSDLPTGWTAKQATAPPQAAAQRATVFACAGVVDSVSAKTDEVRSATYSANGVQVGSRAASYPAQSDVAVQAELLGSPRISQCYTDLVRAQLVATVPAGAVVDSVVVRVVAGNGPGPVNVIGTATGTATVTAPGQSQTIYLSSAFISGPLTDAEVDIQSVGAPVLPDLAAGLFIAVAARANKP